MVKRKDTPHHIAKGFIRYEVPATHHYGKQKGTTFWAKDDIDAADYIRKIKQLTDKEK
jgi:hypothetical protein